MLEKEGWPMEHQDEAKVKTPEAPQRHEATRPSPVASGAPLHPILQLQRLIGNRAVQRLLANRGIPLQAKLRVGAADDCYEQEANRVARQVMNASDAVAANSMQRARPSEDPAASITPFVQRQRGNQQAWGNQEQSVQAKRSAETGREPLQRPAEPEGEKTEPIQTKSPGARGDPFEAGAKLETQLSRSKGRGSPLPNPVRAYMEPRFGADFRQVLVHTGSEAVQMNQAVGAQAFTHGSDIYFGAGQRPTNLELTAHELTHVVQQTGGAPLQAKKREGQAAPPGPEPCLQRAGAAYARKEKGLAPIFLQTKPTTQASPSVFERAAAPGADGAAPAAATAAQQVERLVIDAKRVLELAATGLGLHELTIEGSVGRGGKNRPHDVAAVAVRLLVVGYPPGSTLGELAAAIARYQAEVVGLPRPDGRIDPGGKTIAALGAMKRAPAAAEAPAVPAAAASPPVATVPPPATAPTPPVVAAPTPAVAAGPRGTPQDPALAQLVAAARNPEVDAAAGELADLEKKFKGLKHSEKNEEIGEGRDELVKRFGSLRARIAALDKAGLDPKVAAELKALFYRAMNAISPYYFQGLNIILEFDRVNKTTGKLEHVWNTCNITSLSMALEALGKSAADYKHKALIPPIAQVYKKDVQELATSRITGSKSAEAQAQHEVSSAELSGLRLPDYVAMAAIVWQMGYKPGSPEDILKGGNLAFGHIPSAEAVIQLARDFGASAKYGAFKLDPSAKKDGGSHALEDYGSEHNVQARVHAEAGAKVRELERQLERETNAGKRAKLEAEKATVEAQLAKREPLSDAAIESKLPLEQYKRSVLAQVRPELDSGRQLIVGQFNHFVRLQAVTEDFVIKDDPGRFTGVNMQVTWEEARAMGLFWNWISIG
jgi:hypothetical protein